LLFLGQSQIRESAYVTYPTKNYFKIMLSFKHTHTHTHTCICTERNETRYKRHDWHL